MPELDETADWLELLIAAKIVGQEKLEGLLKETEELMAIFVTIVKKVKSRKTKS